MTIIWFRVRTNEQHECADKWTCSFAISFTSLHFWWHEYPSHTLMSSNVLLSSNIPPSTTLKHSNCPILASQCITFNKRDILTPISATSASISYPQPQPQPSFNVDYLETEFGTDGVSFNDLGESYVIKMGLENGSSANVLLPSGLITSYKPKMWHGGSVEVLHTSVLQDSAGDTVIRGGVSLCLECSDDDGFLWCPDTWVLNSIQGSSEESIEVEMISRDVDNRIEVKHNLTLKDDTLKSEIIISTLTCSQLKMRGSILSHLNVSTPEATYAYGLEGSNFSDIKPLSSNFIVVPPDTRKGQESGSWKNLFSAKMDEKEVEEETEGEEDDNCKQLTSKMCRIYTYAPRSFIIIDRGKRNSVDVGRTGFEEVYLYSPGASHESYGKYSYICVGQSALLKPVSFGPQQVWRGEQLLHNPNL